MTSTSPVPISTLSKAPPLGRHLYRAEEPSVDNSLEDVSASVREGLMRNGIERRMPLSLRLSSGHEVIDFANCSYLGLDTDPRLITAAKDALDQWGIHFCCARSRLSIGALLDLEEELSQHFGGRAITFPSVTVAHSAVLPLVKSGKIIPAARRRPGPVRFVFDRFAHASMQALKPLLRDGAEVATIGHNDLSQLASHVREANRNDQTCVYLADGLYSMGGESPIKELLQLAEANENLILYIDDAHGTSIVGNDGEGFVASQLSGPWPEYLFANFSLAKGFGCNGGGIIVSSPEIEEIIRTLAVNYAFSGPLDFSIVGAARASLAIQKTQELAALQKKLRSNVAYFDQVFGLPSEHPLSPIRMVGIGSTEKAIRIGRALLDRGFYVPVVFYPVVPRNSAQLRVVLSVKHTEEQIQNLAQCIKELVEA